jgi:predicted membrane metal-binding protein
MGPFLVLMAAFIFGSSGLPETLAKFTTPAHKICTSRFLNSEQKEFHAAIICGANLESVETYESFRRTGLIHLIVVSGTHLVWIEIALRLFLARFPRGKWLSVGLLILFAVAARLQPPIVRAGLSMALTSANRRWSLGWTPLHRALFAGVLTLFLFPKWLGSTSLLLSWSAALVLSLDDERNRDPWRKQITIYLVMFVLLLPLAAPHPLTIVFNVLVAPLVAGLLFPLSVIVFVLPFSAVLLDPLLAWALWLLELLSRLVPDFAPSYSVAPFFLWIYLFSVQAYWLFCQIRARRQII